PNVLLTGGTGIAVGRATDIPPHNIHEVAAATIHLLNNPDADTDELMAHLPAPDFPTGAEIITPVSEIRHMYATGNGQVRVRARYSVQSGEVIITELPYQTSGAKVLAQIATQMAARKLPMVSDLR